MLHFVVLILIEDLNHVYILKLVILNGILQKLQNIYYLII